MSKHFSRYLSLAIAALTVAAAPALAQEPAADCVVGNHRGFDDPDAYTAAALVCDSVRYQGVAVGAPMTEEQSTAAVIYRVRLDRLGEAVFVSLQKESPKGKPITARRMKLAKLEELSVVSDRLALAVLKNISLESTQTVTTISKDEGRKLEQIGGDFSWGPGIDITTPLNDNAVAAPGFSLRFVYETGNFDVGAAFRFGGDFDEENFAYIGGEISSHYLFLDGDITPFLGGGIELIALSSTSRGSYDEDSDYYDYDSQDGFGPAAFIEGGVEILRLHRTHLRGLVRLDMPLFAMESFHYDYASSESYTERSYVPTLTVGASILF